MNNIIKRAFGKISAWLRPNKNVPVPEPYHMQAPPPKFTQAEMQRDIKGLSTTSGAARRRSRAHKAKRTVKKLRNRQKRQV